MHFLLFPVIKIAKGYLRESTEQFNTFGIESVQLQSDKTITDYILQLNSPGHGEVDTVGWIQDYFPL